MTTENISRTKTRHFKNCLGVFQGGGCKALAFIGAYAEAEARGVFFSRVAGTSAGAIVAALIAAGASAAELQNQALAINPASFRGNPEPRPKPPDAGWLVPLLRITGKKRYLLLADFISHLGKYSSFEIEAWMDRTLKELLKLKGSGFVRFSDLNIPLHVVATDLKSAQPMIWSMETTPQASVAHAVRCSCTIPGYFQAVDSIYVDGGIVSNLPTFVLSQVASGSFEKILCFSFEPDARTAAPQAEAEATGVESYLKSVASAAIDGATKIQNSLQDNLHVIEIGNLPLRTLDFDKISRDSVAEMFRAGEIAARQFFDAEIANIHAPNGYRPLFKTEAETLNQIVREDLAPGNSVAFALKSTRYVYNLFPSFLHWARKGVRITFICEAPQGSRREMSHEAFRRFALKTLGASVVQVEQLEFEGVLFFRQTVPDSVVVFDERRRDSNAPCFATRYQKTVDSAAINALHAVVAPHIPVASACADSPRFSIQRGGLDELIRRLKTVEQYSSESVSITLEEIDVGRIIFLTKFVKSYKYNQIYRIFDLYSRVEARCFEPLEIVRDIGAQRVVMPITPPVVEQHGEDLYVIEGNNRLLHLVRERGATRALVLVVRGVSSALPSEGKMRIGQIRVTDEERTGEQRYVGFQRQQFREIEEKAHNPDLYSDYNYD